MSDAFRFRVNDLGPGDDADIEQALAAARELEAAAAAVEPTAGPLFTDRVMAALANEPSPAPGGFLLPLRLRGFMGGFALSVRQAWASLGAGRPPIARAAALAYVLLIATVGVSVAGAASFGAAGAWGFLAPTSTVVPTNEPNDRTEAPEASLAPAVEPSEPAESPEADESPEASPDETEGPEDHGGGTGPQRTDDHGGNSGPGDGGGDGGGSDDHSGPGSTEEPEESDDHSGSDDGSGGGGGSDDGSGSGTGSGTDSGSGGGSLDD